MKDIVLIGGGGHAKSCIDVIELEGKFKIYGIVDSKVKDSVLGHKVIGTDDDLPEIFKTCQNAIVCIGHIKSNEARVRAFLNLKQIGFNLPTIISPLAYVSKHAVIGKGSIVMHHALINAGARVGENCIINSKALIEHDAVVEDNCHISTASVLNGGVVVRENTFFGSNSMAREYITIGKNCVVGGGMRIVKTLSDNTIIKRFI
ncbi:NeuD/PglB/VioB family sugar acetyltransferase [Campylobacter mucosalis]|uniref:NeuD/PglB/VioB family sugar acetyltransferase n=1 Tax=Campylobacter mucosalis TaxID=202 RepID=UPI0014707BC3|nr:NeuD/PglB/VioB family sugar acetyltransferase [Campylobacter mucosalis]